MVNEAIVQVPSHLQTIVVTDNTIEKLTLNSDIINSVEIISASPTEFDRISSQKTPQQVLAVIDQGFINDQNRVLSCDLILALDRIQDPGNLGTIIRLANWFGASQIYCSPDTVDCFNAKVVQASMGAILRVSIKYEKLPERLALLRDQLNYTIYGTSLAGNNVYEIKLKMPAVVVLGNESSGVSEALLNLSDNNLFIPEFSMQPSKSESLNVSIAAAIICSEFRRR